MPRNTLQRPQHRPVAAEHDRELDVCGIAARLEIVLRRLVRRDDELDRRSAGDRHEPLDARRRPARAGRA